MAAAARKVKPVTATELDLGGTPPRAARRLRSNIEEPTPPDVLAHRDAPVARARRTSVPKDIPSPKPTTVTATDYIKILVEENENIPPTGMFVGLNGRGYLIKPGVTVPVPPGVLEILNNAVEKMAVIDPQTRQVIGYRDRMRYPYRVI